MTTQILAGTGNLSNGNVFGPAELGAGALAMALNTNVALGASSSQASPAFTITNADVIDGVLMMLYATAATPGGTLTIALQKSGVTQASVTVNVADLPHSATGRGISDPDILTTAPPYVFFRFTGTATGDGAATWTILLTTSAGNSGITYEKNSATAGDFTRALRTTVRGNPVANDNLYIMGELSGAGTHNNNQCIMDVTAGALVQYGNGTLFTTTTQQGEVIIGCYGTLSWGNAASTQYYFQVKGNFDPQWQGTVNVAGGAMPRSSGGILEMVMAAANGDFGIRFRNGSIVDLEGLSRTAGKNVIATKLTADVTGSCLAAATASNGTLTGGNAIDEGGIDKLAATFTDNATASATHSVLITGIAVTNVTQVVQAWLVQGSGAANNRYVRVGVGNAATWNSVVNGFYTDVDTQLGTASGPTALGNGTATSVSIVAQGGGWLVTLIGICSSALATPTAHLVSCSALGTTVYTGTTTVCFAYKGFVFLTQGSITDTTWNVADDTGWLAGDMVCVAPTQRTWQDNENFMLSANAAAGAFTTHRYPFGNGGQNLSAASTHSGTAPTQGEVCLITRNFKIRSAPGPGLVSFIYKEPLSTVTLSWCEISGFGMNASGKFGFIIGGGYSPNQNGLCSVSYCCFHSMPFNWFYYNSLVNSTYSLNFNCQHNVIFNSGDNQWGANGTVLTLADWNISFNYFMKISGACLSIADSGGVWNNNTVSSVNNQAVSHTTNMTIQPGSFDNNTVHNCANEGFHPVLSNNQVPWIGTISNFTCWHMSGVGAGNGGAGIESDITWINPIFFGNTTDNWVPLGGHFTAIGGVLCGDPNFATTVNFAGQGSGGIWQIDLDGTDLSGASLGLAPCTTADFVPNAMEEMNVVCRGCYIGAPASPKGNWMQKSFISYENYNKVNGDHRTEMLYGQIRTDQTIFNLAAPSMRVTPTNSTFKQASAPKHKGIKVAVANGASVNISAYVRTSVGSDGASSAYGGNLPRLIQRGN